MFAKPLRLLPVAVACLAAPLSGQGQFGRAVAVGPDGQVMVLKPTSGRGPAALLVYGRRSGENEWVLEQELHGIGGVESGHGLSASVAVAGGLLFVGSGDPSVAFGAHVFRRDGGGWMADGRITLRPDRSATPLAGQTLDLAGLMRIMQPASRTVATDGNLVVVGVTGGTTTTNGVWVFARVDGDWRMVDSLAVEGVAGAASFGASVAVRGSRVAVGAPRHGAGGMAFVFQLGKDGAHRLDSLTPGVGAENAEFGTGIAFVGDDIVVGAPGTRFGRGFVARFARETRDGTWRETDRVTSANATAVSRFGAAFSVSGAGLWVGAPLADRGRGLVFHFVDSPAGWKPRGAVGSGLPEERTLFGSSVAAGDEVVIAGAPAAAGGSGRASVRVRTADGGWSEPAVLSPAGGPTMIAGGEVSCQDGTAAGFDCNNVDLLAFLPIDALGGRAGERVSDLWGWTDPATRREYALVGRTGAAVFVDVTNPAAPVRVGELPANPSGARDLKVYRNHLFFTGDGAGQHGLVIFDLTRLRDATGPPVTFQPDTVYDGIASAHNLILDAESGFAYPVGASGGGETCGGGLHMIDVREPKRPVFAGCYTDTEGLIYAGRTHDGQCVVYRGPDTAYRGRQLCFASNETALRIVDVSDKANPTPIAVASYPGIAYAHQGWLTDDHRYFYLNDELDELVGTTARTRTLVWDVAELDDPVMIGEHFGPNGSTDHNLYVKGDRMYQANYQAGLRVIDIRDPRRPEEIGYFDTTPYQGNPPGFVGAWTAFPFFESGTVIVSSMNEGLFLLRPRPAALIP